MTIFYDLGNRRNFNFNIHGTVINFIFDLAKSILEKKWRPS